MNFNIQQSDSKNKILSLEKAGININDFNHPNIISNLSVGKHLNSNLKLRTRNEKINKLLGFGNNSTSEKLKLETLSQSPYIDEHLSLPLLK